MTASPRALLCLLLSPWLAVAPALADPAHLEAEALLRELAARDAAGPTRLGKIERSEGTVRGDLRGQGFVDLRPGQAVHTGDVLKTAGDEAILVVRLEGGGRLAIGGDSRVSLLATSAQEDLTAEIEYGNLLLLEVFGDLGARAGRLARWIVEGTGLVVYDPKQQRAFATAVEGPLTASTLEEESQVEVLQPGYAMLCEAGRPMKTAKLPPEEFSSLLDELRKDFPEAATPEPTPAPARPRDCDLPVALPELEDLVTRGERLKRIKTEPLFEPPPDGRIFDYKLCLQGDTGTFSVDASIAQQAAGYVAALLSANLLPTGSIGTAARNTFAQVAKRVASPGDASRVTATALKGIFAAGRGIRTAGKIAGAFETAQLISPVQGRVTAMTLDRLSQAGHGGLTELKLPAAEALEVYRQFEAYEERVSHDRADFLCGLLEQERRFLEEARAARAKIDRSRDLLEGEGGCGGGNYTDEGRALLADLTRVRRQLASLVHFHQEEADFRARGDIKSGQWTLEKAGRFLEHCGR